MVYFTQYWENTSFGVWKFFRTVIQVALIMKLVC